MEMPPRPAKNEMIRVLLTVYTTWTKSSLKAMPDYRLAEMYDSIDC